MKKLDRYVASIFLSNSFLTLSFMSFLIFSQAVFKDLYDHEYVVRQILYYHFLNLPQSIVQVMPPAILLATVVTLSGLSRTQELVAYFSLGFGLRRLMVFVFVIVIVFSSLILIVEDKVLPPIFKARTSYKMKIMDRKTDFFLDIKRDKIWYRSKNMIYNLKRFDGQTNTIYGMSIYTLDDDFNLVQMIGAEKAHYSEKRWKLINGTVTVFSDDDPFPLTQKFLEKEMLIAETPREFQEIEKEVDGLSFKELHHYIQRMKSAGASTRSYEVKFHTRLSLSVVSFVMCLLGVPFSVGLRREGGKGKDLALCLAITFFYWLFYSVGLSLGTNGTVAPWLAAWIPSLIFLSIAITLIVRKH